MSKYGYHDATQLYPAGGANSQMWLAADHVDGPKCARGRRGSSDVVPGVIGGADVNGGEVDGFERWLGREEYYE